MRNKLNTSSRLLALDVLRGMTIAGMILVNNPGDWGSVYTPLEHAQWNGLTPTDLVFPFFVFIMGVSMYLSFKKFDFKFSLQTFYKLLRRSALIFMVGLALNWLSLFFHGLNAHHNEPLQLLDNIWQAASNLENLRILNVLQRLAFISLTGSLILLSVKHKRILWVIGFILMAYWVLIDATGSYLQDENSIIALVDQNVLGISHMYTDHLPDGKIVIFDPEGLISTIPCIAHVLLGCIAGKIISETKEHGDKIQKLFLFGTIILFIGFLLNYGFPINKKIWSSSFVLVTSGFAALMLGLLIWVIDIKQKKNWSTFFESFGVNPLFIYVVASVMGILIVNISFNYNGEWLSVKSYIYDQYIQALFGNYQGSLLYALCFVSVNWLIGHILYKKRIFIKL